MHNNMKILAAVLVLVVICGTVIAVATIANKREAQAFLSEIRNTQLGPGGYARLKEIETRFHNHVVANSESCSPNQCSLTLSFQNTWLRRLHLAIWTKFGATLLVKNENLYYISAGMTLYTPARVIGSETILSDQDKVDSKPFTVVTKRWGDNQPWQAIVMLTPRAAPTERESAFAFNLSCLNKLGGCKDSSDLLPSAWREKQEGR